MIFKTKEELKEYIIQNGVKETSGVGKNKVETINLYETLIVFNYFFNGYGECYSHHNSNQLYRYNVNRDVVQVYGEVYSYWPGTKFVWKPVKFEDDNIICSTSKEGEEYVSVYVSEHQDQAKKNIENYIKELNKGIKQSQKKIKTLEKKLKTFTQTPLIGV